MFWKKNLNLLFLVTLGDICTPETGEGVIHVSGTGAMSMEQIIARSVINIHQRTWFLRKATMISVRRNHSMAICQRDLDWSESSFYSSIWLWFSLILLRIKNQLLLQKIKTFLWNTVTTNQAPEISQTTRKVFVFIEQKLSLVHKPAMAWIHSQSIITDDASKQIIHF